MEVPEEDLGPRWLRDYQSIEADIAQMAEFAAKLEAEVRQNYATHLPYVSDIMTRDIPQPAVEFLELSDFLTTHRAAQDATQTNVYNYRDGTGYLARAAGIVSERYRNSDAFAHARVSDVRHALREAAMPGEMSADVNLDVEGH